MHQLRHSRRNFLRASGIAVALPLFESAGRCDAARPDSSRRRLIAINNGLGLHGPNTVPTEAGTSYTLSPYLQELDSFRDQLTFISGCSHPGVGGGHQSGKSFLTAARHPNSAGFQNSISIDQLAAEQLGTQTRFGSLALSTSGPGLSWSRSGVEIPAEVRPSRIYEKLFLEGKPSEKARQIQRLQDGRSVLDLVTERTASMAQKLSGRDRDKMDQYMTAVREAERRLVKAEAWQQRPKPEVDAGPPRDETDRTKMLECLGLMYDMMHLALQSDSTRFITLYHTGMNAVPKIPGVDTDYHMLSHHGKDPAKIDQLTTVESGLFRVLGKFLQQLRDAQEEGQSLLDQTMVLFGSNLGNASSHDTRNMPILLAGGGFQHGQHLAFDQTNNYALPKLYVSMLQRLGLEIDSFAETTGTMTGLEMV